MKLMDLIFGKKEEKPYWVEMDYGFVPRMACGLDSPVSGGAPGAGVAAMHSPMASAADTIVRTDAEGKEVKVKVYPFKSMMKGWCPTCSKVLLVPEISDPTFFTCPFCVPQDQEPLVRYLLNLNDKDESFNQCPSCDSYSSLKLVLEPDKAALHCPDCGKDNVIAREHEISFGPFAEGMDLLWCSWCGRYFEVQKGTPEPIDCPKCTSAGVIVRRSGTADGVAGPPND